MRPLFRYSPFSQSLLVLHACWLWFSFSSCTLGWACRSALATFLILPALQHFRCCRPGFGTGRWSERFCRGRAMTPGTDQEYLFFTMDIVRAALNLSGFCESFCSFQERHLYLPKSFQLRSSRCSSEGAGS